jgi:hypothetical protein
MENNVEGPQNIKNKTTMPNATSVYIFKRKETSLSKRHLYIHVHCSWIHNRQEMEMIYVSKTDEWIKKPWYYSTMRKDEILSFSVTCMDNDHIISLIWEGHGERCWSQLEKVLVSCCPTEWLQIMYYVFQKATRKNCEMMNVWRDRDVYPNLDITQYTHEWQHHMEPHKYIQFWCFIHQLK